MIQQGLAWSGQFLDTEQLLANAETMAVGKRPGDHKNDSALSSGNLTRGAFRP
jgi:hypothetical protein